MELPATALTADDARRRIREMLEADGLPLYAFALSGREPGWLSVSWAHGLNLDFDLSRGVIEPFDDLDRRAILGLGLGERFPLPVDSLIDLAWSLNKAQLQEAFGRLRDEDLLDPDAVRVERARVGALLNVLDEVIGEYC